MYISSDLLIVSKVLLINYTTLMHSSHLLKFLIINYFYLFFLDSNFFKFFDFANLKHKT